MLGNSRLETLILRSLRTDESYSRRVLPFLKETYFSERSERIVFELIRDFFLKYNSTPTHEALVITLDKANGVKEEDAKAAVEVLEALQSFSDDKPEEQWLLDETEQFCQDKAVYNAILESISIMDDKTGKTSPGAIPQLLSDALAVSFDTHVGHDYLDDSDDRFEEYHRVDKKIPFGIEMLDIITNGGVQTKTLNLITGGINVGKTLGLCHLAATYLNQGLNVLYITLEMSEQEISKRIDANLLNVDINELDKLSKEMYAKKMKSLRERITGKLIVKEYPTAGASVIHFKALLNELNIKKNFKPTILIVDYINLMCSSRLKADAAGDTYNYVKSIAAELRGLNVEHDLAGWTATQLTRKGFDSSDPGMTDTAESFALPATVDLQLIIVTTEELEKLKQLMVKQAKNRYNRKSVNRKFMIGVDECKMRWHDVEQRAQEDLVGANQPLAQEKPVFDNTPVGKVKYAGWDFGEQDAAGS